MLLLDTNTFAALKDRNALLSTATAITSYTIVNTLNRQSICRMPSSCLMDYLSFIPDFKVVSRAIVRFQCVQ